MNVPIPYIYTLFNWTALGLTHVTKPRLIKELKKLIAAEKALINRVPPKS